MTALGPFEGAWATPQTYRKRPLDSRFISPSLAFALTLPRRRAYNGLVHMISCPLSLGTALLCDLACGRDRPCVPTFRHLQELELEGLRDQKPATRLPADDWLLETNGGSRRQRRIFIMLPSKWRQATPRQDG